MKVYPRNECVQLAPCEFQTVGGVKQPLTRHEGWASCIIEIAIVWIIESIVVTGERLATAFPPLIVWNFYFPLRTDWLRFIEVKNTPTIMY